MNKEFKSIFLVVALFLVSIILRVDTFRNAQLGMDVVNNNFGYSSKWHVYSNQEVFIHDCFVFEVYDKFPVRDHLFGSFIGYDPQYLQPNSESPIHKKASVYPSFPATGFIAAYLFLKTMNLPRSYEGLQIFGLFLHFLTCIFVYFLIVSLFANSPSKNFLGVLASSVYIFSTGSMHQHMNVYWSHQLLQPLWIGALLYFVRKKGQLSLSSGFFIGFLLSVVNWTGIFAAFGFFLFFMKDKKIQNSLLVALGIGTAQILVLAQTLRITGATLGDYMSVLLLRGGARSTVSYTYGTFSRFIELYSRALFLSYGAYLILAIILSSFWLLQKNKKMDSFVLSVFLISLVPMVESLFILQHDSQYLFGQLKILPPMIILISIFSNEFLTYKRVLSVAFILCAGVHYGIYQELYHSPTLGKTSTPEFLTDLTRAK